MAREKGSNLLNGKEVSIATQLVKVHSEQAVTTALSYQCLERISYHGEGGMEGNREGKRRGEER